MWLCGTWQLSLQLKQENSSSSPTESSRPRPTTSQPACPHVSTAARQETARLGSANSAELHTNYHCQCSQSLPWIIGVNEQPIRSAQVSWASQKVKEDIKEDGATQGLTTQNTAINLWSQFDAASTCLKFPLMPTHLHQNRAIRGSRSTFIIYTLEMGQSINVV